jgi:hypothetical protein
MTDGLVEKVARAIAVEANGPATDWPAWLPEARAALRVVRDVMAEPDDAMKQAGSNALTGWVAPAMHSADAWRAMLAASPLGRVE